MKQGMGLLEILLNKQPVNHNHLLLKVIHSSFIVTLLLFVEIVCALLFFQFVFRVPYLLTDVPCFCFMQNIEICRLYELDSVSSNIMKV